MQKHEGPRHTREDDREKVRQRLTTKWLLVLIAFLLLAIGIALMLR